jgi:hypothetical protein
MLMFLATVLEQLDFALEQAGKKDIHNARFGLMLTDNAVELVLHQIAKDKSSSLNMFGKHGPEYEHQAALEKALGRNFKDKVRFARLEQHVDSKLSKSINIMHEFRYEVYHAGLQHQEILPVLAVFYFDVACHFFETFYPMGIGWGSALKLPERAQKYFNGTGFMPGSL